MSGTDEQEDVETVDISTPEGRAAVLALFKLEGGLLTGRQVAAGLRISEVAINVQRRLGKLLAVPNLSKGRNQFLYPAWQIYRGASLPGLKEILQILNNRGFDAYMQAQFFVTAGASGVRPLDLMRRGELEAVLQDALTYMDPGTCLVTLVVCRDRKHHPVFFVISVWQ